VLAKIYFKQIYLDIPTASTVPQKFYSKAAPEGFPRGQGKPFAQIRPKKTGDRDISVISRRFFLLYKVEILLPHFRFGSKMFFLTRRSVIAGASVSAATCLAGCASTNPNPSLNAASPPPSPANPAMADAVEPQYSSIYAEIKDDPFTVPAVKLAQVDSAFLRKNINYATNDAPGTIVIDPANHYLYHVEDGGRATRYGVGVGREGFAWAGEARIKSKQEWPDWYPPKEMIDRRPDLKKVMVELQSGVGMHGGPANPLGARAMYLWQGDKDTYFRIHGTNEPWTIGLSQSSGCIRMINQDAMDLYQKTPVGTRVVVLGSPGAIPAKVAHV
jgi:lipoprotein-anchoring transpeptidase ErfK/SrfK